MIQFKAYLSDLWTNIAMMDYPYPTTFLMPLPGNPVNAACKLIQDTMVQPNRTVDNKLIIEAIAAGVNMYNNYTGNAKCLPLGN